MITFEEAHRILDRVEQKSKDQKAVAIERFDRFIHTMALYHEDFSKTCELAMRRYRMNHPNGDDENFCYGSIDTNPVFLQAVHDEAGNMAISLAVFKHTDYGQYQIVLLPNGHIRLDGQWTTIEKLRDRLCGTDDLNSNVMVNVPITFMYLLDWLEVMVPDRLGQLKVLLLEFIEALEK